MISRTLARLILGLAAAGAAQTLVSAQSSPLIMKSGRPAEAGTADTVQVTGNIIVSGATNRYVCPVSSAFDATEVYTGICQSYSTTASTPSSQMALALSGTANFNATVGAEAVGIFSGITALSGAPNTWAFTSAVDIKSGANNGAVSAEVDLINENCDPGPAWSRIAGCPSGRYGGLLLDGIGATTGIYPNEAALWVLTGNSGVLWHTGLLLSGNSVDSAAIADLTNSVKILYAQGSHTDGINLARATFSGSAIVTPSFSVDGSGNVSGSRIGAGTFFRPPVYTLANLTGTADPSPQVGDYSAISDATACTANTVVTGGGTHICPVTYTSKGWRATVSN